MCTIKVNPNCSYEFLVHAFSIKRLAISENQLRQKVKRNSEEKLFGDVYARFSIPTSYVP